MCAQNLSADQKQLIFENASNLIIKWHDSKELHTPFQSTYNEAMAIEFKKLFTNDAKLFDIAIPLRDSLGKIDAPVRPAGVMSVNDYTDRVKSNFKGGIYYSRIHKMDADYEKLEDGTIVYLMEREQFTELNDAAKKPITMTITDTLRMELQVNKADGTVLISSIATAGYSVQCLECPKPKPTKPPITTDTTKTKPPKQPREPREGMESSFSFKLDACGGPGKLSFDEISVTGLDRDVYIGMINSQTSIKSYEIDPQSFASGFNMMLQYTRGRNAKFGLMTGISFLSQKAEVNIGQFNVHYRSIDNNSSFANKSYNRLIQVRDAHEEIKVNSLNIPLALVYQQKAGISLIEFYAGVMVGMSHTVKSDGNATADFEGYYSAGGFDNTGNQANAVWLVTDESMADDASTTPLNEELIRAAATSDFGWGIAKTGTFEHKFTSQTGTVFGVQYVHNSVGLFSPFVGIQYYKQVITQFGKDYWMFNNKVNDYQSTLTAVDTIKLNATTIRIGFSLNF
ncbi:MAG: hypothetical protein ACKVOR_01980 [Flavobacteriales bacterium]